MENPVPQQNVFGNQMARSLPNATASLVLGIISIVGCFCYGIVGLICGIIALILSSKDIKLYNANPGMYSQGSYKNTKAGRVCAIIGLCLSVLYLIFVIFILVTVGTAALNDPNLWREIQNAR